jgi:hypothetical protein
LELIPFDRFCHLFDLIDVYIFKKLNGAELPSGSVIIVEPANQMNNRKTQSKKDEDVKEQIQTITKTESKVDTVVVSSIAQTNNLKSIHVEDHFDEELDEFFDSL